jgi:hypothetical protein
MVDPDPSIVYDAVSGAEIPPPKIEVTRAMIEACKAAMSGATLENLILDGVGDLPFMDAWATYICREVERARLAERRPEFVGPRCVHGSPLLTGPACSICVEESKLTLIRREWGL